MDPKPNKKRLQAGLDAARAKEKKAMESARATEAAAKARKESGPKKLSEMLGAEGRLTSGDGGKVMKKKTEPRPMAKKEKMPKKKMGGPVPAKVSKVKKPPMRMMGGGMMKSKMGTKGGAMGGKKKMAPGMKAGGKFPDLTGDGKVTKKDVLKGRGVPGFKEGGKKVSKGYAKGGMKMKSKMTTKGGAKGGGYKKGGRVRGVGIARKGVRPVKHR